MSDTVSDGATSDGAERARSGNETEHHADPHSAGVDHELLGPFAPARNDPASHACRRPLSESPPHRQRADNGNTPACRARDRGNADEGEEGKAERDDDVANRAEHCPVGDEENEAAKGGKTHPDPETRKATLTADATFQVDDSAGDNAPTSRLCVLGR